MYLNTSYPSYYMLGIKKYFRDIGSYSNYIKFHGKTTEYTIIVF